MGEARKEALRVDFDSQINLEFNGAAITSDAGLVAYRELDEALSLTEMTGEGRGVPSGRWMDRLYVLGTSNRASTATKPAPGTVDCSRNALDRSP